MAFPRLLSILANKLNASGQVPLSTGTTETLTTARGGTNITAAGASGNVLTSDGTNWTSAAPKASGGGVGGGFFVAGTGG